MRRVFLPSLKRHSVTIAAGILAAVVLFRLGYNYGLYVASSMVAETFQLGEHAPSFDWNTFAPKE